MNGKAAEGELLDQEFVARVEALTLAALRRTPAHEARLAGSLRVLSPHSSKVCALLGSVVEALVKRGSFDRPLYAASIRALAEHSPSRGAPDLERALAFEDAGGLPTLSAACWVEHGRLARALARVAGSRHPQLAFAAEVARIARGESDGEHIASLAPKIKEAHRIALCVEVLFPLLRHPALPLSIAPALSVLRDAERHLGRWLVFAEIAVRAGDRGPLEEARGKAASGPPSARAAWGLVAWALGDGGDAPGIRPTVELVSRLSDRPSADRDPTFLFRLAEARVPSARPMLESFVRGPLRSDAAIRSALFLARDHGRDDLRGALRAVADNPRHDGLRGVAASALHDLGERDTLAETATALLASRRLPTATWGALLRVAAARKIPRLLTEATYRRLQLGWIE